MKFKHRGITQKKKCETLEVVSVSTKQKSALRCYRAALIFMSSRLLRMGGACGTYGGGERGTQGVGGKTLGKEAIGETQPYMGG
jgi:hypothetical protein